MDSLTHIVIGACIGEAILGKRIGKRAMLIGAIAQSVPDIDVIAAFWNTPAHDLIIHRSFTHSLLFALLMAPVLAGITRRLFRSYHLPFITLILFFGLQDCLHILLDGFNAYGTGWLEPFSSQRFSFNTIFVADPLFTVWPLIACIALLILRNSSPSRKTWWYTALILSSFYLGYTVVNKMYIDTTVKRLLKQQHVTYTDYMTTPTPLNSWLWYIIVKQQTGYSIGYRSVFDSDNELPLHFFPRNDSLLNDVKDKESLRYLLRFSKGYYAVQQSGDTILFNDLRFGQTAGWSHPDGGFIFHYYLTTPADNNTVIQRGRMAGWNKTEFNAFLRRIRGN